MTARIRRVLLAVLLAPAASAQEPRIDCSFLTTALGTIPLDVLVDAIEGDRPIDPGLLGCARDLGAPAQVVDAIRRRLALVSDAVDTPWIPVDTTSDVWPEQLGRSVVASIQLLVPGDVPMVVLFARGPDSPRVPWWYLEKQDRVAARLLERLPADSAAAESPSVLDADAVGLTDPVQAPDLHDRLRRMGYRRVLVIREQPVVGSDATDLVIAIEDLDSATVRETVVRVLPAASTLPDPGAVQVRVDATPSPAAPGSAVQLTVRPVRGPLPDGPVEVWSAGARLATLAPVGDTHTGILQVPDDPKGPWRLHVVHPTQAGGLGWLSVELPVRAGASHEEKARTLEASYDEATVGVRRRSQLVKRAGVIVGAGIGGGMSSLVEFGGSPVAVAAETWTVSGYTYREQGDQGEIFPSAAGYLDIPIEVALQLPGLRIGGRLDLRPYVGGGDLEAGTTTQTNEPIRHRAGLSVDPSGSLLFGGRNPRTGGWFGPWIAWQQRGARATFDRESVRLDASRAVVGTQLTVDHDLRRRIGLGVDVRTTMARFAGTTGEAYGGSPSGVDFIVDVDIAIRVYWRGR